MRLSKGWQDFTLEQNAQIYDVKALRINKGEIPRINSFFYCRLFVLILVGFFFFVVVVVFFSLRFGQISPLAFFFRWLTATSDRNAEFINHITALLLPSIVVVYRTTFFHQVNLWPAWVGFETAIFWQCSPGTVQTQSLYPLRHGPRRATKVGFFWSYKSNYRFSLSGLP